MDESRLRILSVEDDALNRALVRASLARAGDQRVRSAEVVEVTSLSGARLALGSGTFDFVLLDRRLPDGDGFELATEIRSGSGSSRPVVVGLTADAVPQTTVAAMEAGCDELLTKPFAPHELIGALVRHLGN